MTATGQTRDPDVERKLAGLEQFRIAGLINDARYQIQRAVLLQRLDAGAAGAPPPPPDPAGGPPAPRARFRSGLMRLLAGAAVAAIAVAALSLYVLLRV